MPIIPHHHESRHRGPKPFYLEAVSKQRDSRVDRLGPSRWQAYHVGLATVRAQSPATTCTAICLLAIDGTEGSKLAATHHTSARIILSQHPSLRSPARHNDHSPRPYVLSSAFFARGQKTKPIALFIPLARTLCCLFFCFCFLPVNLVFATFPFSSFFFFWISKCSHLFAVPLLFRLLHEEGRRFDRSWRNTWTWLLLQEFVCLIGGIDLCWRRKTCRY